MTNELAKPTASWKRSELKMCLDGNRQVAHGETKVISGQRSPSGRWGVGLLLGGATLSQLLIAAASPLLTRLYSPGDFGVLAVYASIVSLLVVVAAMRYELAIPLARDAREAASVGAAAIIATALSATGVAAGVLGFGELVLTKLNAAAIIPFAWLLPAGVLGGGLYQVLSYWVLRDKQYRVLASTRVTQSLAQAGVQVGAAFFFSGPFGLLTGDAIGRAFGSMRMARKIWAQHRESIRSITWRSIWSAAVAYRRFPLVSSFSVLFNNAGLQISPLALAWLHGPIVAGWFALAQKVVGIPMRLVGEAVAQVYFSEAATFVHDNIATVWSLFKRTAWRLFLFALLPVLVIAIAGPFLFDICFGNEWSRSGVYAQIMLPMFVGQIVASPLSQTLNLVGKLEIQLAWDIGRFVAVTAVFLLTYIFRFSPEVTLAIFSGVMLAAYATQIGISAWALATGVSAAAGEETGKPTRWKSIRAT